MTGSLTVEFHKLPMLLIVTWKQLIESLGKKSVPDHVGFFFTVAEAWVTDLSEIFTSVIDAQKLMGQKFLKVTVTTAHGFPSCLFRFLHFIWVTDPPKENDKISQSGRFIKYYTSAVIFSLRQPRGNYPGKLFNNVVLIILRFQTKNK